MTNIALQKPKHSIGFCCTRHNGLFVVLSQIIGPLEQDEVFNQDDFLLLENIILKTSADQIKNKINTMGIEEDRWVSDHFHWLSLTNKATVKPKSVSLRASDLVMKVDALLSSLPKANARLELNFAEERYR